MPSYGRGGSGNFQAVEKENAKVAADLEANQAAADTYSRNPLQSDYLKREPAQYAYTGRGGAGNLYSPQELKESRATPGGEPTSWSETTSTRTHGRGGAGNYEYGLGESEQRAAQKKAEEEQSREKLKQDIEKGVMENLAMPQKAKLPGAEPY